jgi:hypothetical protein
MLKQIIVGCIYLQIILLSTLCFAEDIFKINSVYDVSQDQSLTTSEWDAISQAGAHALMHTHHARNAIHKCILNRFYSCKASII